MILPWVDLLKVFVLVFMLGKQDEGVPVYPANGAETFQGPAGDNYLQMDFTDNPASTREKMPCQSDMLLSYSTVPGEILLAP